MNGDGSTRAGRGGDIPSLCSRTLLYRTTNASFFLSTTVSAWSSYALRGGVAFSANKGRNEDACVLWLKLLSIRPPCQRHVTPLPLQPVVSSPESTYSRPPPTPRTSPSFELSHPPTRTHPRRLPPSRLHLFVGRFKLSKSILRGETVESNKIHALGIFYNSIPISMQLPGSKYGSESPHSRRPPDGYSC